VPCWPYPLCQLCQVAQRVPVPCCRYAHVPMPTPGSRCHPVAQRSADQQRAANWADGNSTKRAPATSMDSRRFPTTGCQLLRIPTAAPGRVAAVQRCDHGCLGYTPCRAAAGTPRANHLLSPLPKSIRHLQLQFQIRRSTARPVSRTNRTGLQGSSSASSIRALADLAVLAHCRGVYVPVPGVREVIREIALRCTAIDPYIPWADVVFL
jgi:hypothetical protein